MMICRNCKNMYWKSKKYTEPDVTYTVTTDVQTEVITLEEAKSFMGIDFPDFDILIPLFIKGAREAAERYTGLSIGERTIQLGGDWKDEDAYMPFAPVNETTDTGVQEVGYTAETLPGDLKIALLQMIHVSFDNRTQGMDFSSSLTLLARLRRRVGL